MPKKSKARAPKPKPKYTHLPLHLLESKPLKDGSLDLVVKYLGFEDIISVSLCSKQLAELMKSTQADAFSRININIENRKDTWLEVHGCKREEGLVTWKFEYAPESRAETEIVVNETMIPILKQDKGTFTVACTARTCAATMKQILIHLMNVIPKVAIRDFNVNFDRKPESFLFKKLFVDDMAVENMNLSGTNFNTHAKYLLANVRVTKNFINKSENLLPFRAEAKLECTEKVRCNDATWMLPETLCSLNCDSVNINKCKFVPADFVQLGHTWKHSTRRTHGRLKKISINMIIGEDWFDMGELTEIGEIKRATCTIPHWNRPSRRNFADYWIVLNASGDRMIFEFRPNIQIFIIFTKAKDIVEYDEKMGLIWHTRFGPFDLPIPLPDKIFGRLGVRDFVSISLCSADMGWLMSKVTTEIKPESKLCIIVEKNKMVFTVCDTKNQSDLISFHFVRKGGRYKKPVTINGKTMIATLAHGRIIPVVCSDMEESENIQHLMNHLRNLLPNRTIYNFIVNFENKPEDIQLRMIYEGFETIENLKLQGDSTNGEAERLISSVEIVESYINESHRYDGFPLVDKIHCSRLIYCDNTTWMRPERLLTLNCGKVILKGCNFANRDLYKFVRHWITADRDDTDKLKDVQIYLTDPNQAELDLTDLAEFNTKRTVRTSTGVETYWWISNSYGDRMLVDTISNTRKRFRVTKADTIEMEDEDREWLWRPVAIPAGEVIDID